jgi:hypothetical protein
MSDITPALPTPESINLLELQRQAQALRQAFFAAGNAGTEFRDTIRAELDRVEGELAQAVAAEAVARNEAATKAGAEAAEAVLKVGTLGAESTGLDASIEIRMHTLPTGMYHLFDPATNPLAVVEVKVTSRFESANRNNRIARLLVRAWIEGLSTEHVHCCEVKVGRSTGPLHLLPTLLPDKVQHITEVQRATLHIRIDDMDGKTEYHQTHTIVMLSRNSGMNCLWDVQKNRLIEDLTPYYGAWVTPNAEPIQLLLRKVVDKTEAVSLLGYLARREKVVEDEVRAIFDVLKDEKLVYVNSTIDFGRSTTQNGQRVRLPRESLGHRTANCLDGTLLFASLMEANSLNAGLVFVPGHALVAWQKRQLELEADTDDDLLRNWEFLETTMVSTHTFDEAVVKGRDIAETYYNRAGGKQDFEQFRLQRLSWLRAKGIYPME